MNAHAVFVCETCHRAGWAAGWRCEGTIAGPGACTLCGTSASSLAVFSLGDRVPESPRHTRGEIRTDEEGALDEVVADGVSFFHLERMDEGSWWMRLDLVAGGAIVVNLAAKRPSHTKIEGMAEREDL